MHKVLCEFLHLVTPSVLSCNTMPAFSVIFFAFRFFVFFCLFLYLVFLGIFMQVGWGWRLPPCLWWPLITSSLGTLSPSPSNEPPHIIPPQKKVQHERKTEKVQPGHDTMKKTNNLLKKVHHEGIKQKKFSQDLTLAKKHVPDSHYTSSQEVQHEQNKPPQKGSLWTKLAPQKMFTMKKKASSYHTS